MLKAQLLMIRQERIDPRTCPAWWKFRLFTRLRRYVCIYLAVEAVLTVMTMLRLPWMWNPIAAMVWELMQVGIAGALGWVFGCPLVAADAASTENKVEKSAVLSLTVEAPMPCAAAVVAGAIDDTTR